MTSTEQPASGGIVKWLAPMFSREALPYWAIFLVALAVRVTDQCFMSASAPTYGLLWPDSHVYDRWAREIAQTFWLGWDRIPFQHGPLYPYYLGMLYLRFEPGITTAAISQRLLGALTVVMVFWLGRRVFGKQAGWFAGLGAAVCPLFLMYESEILVETLVLFLQVAALCLFLKAAERKTWRWWAAAGATLGLCCLGRPNALLLLPPLMFWSWLSAPAKGYRRALPAVVMTFAALLVIAPAPLLNYAVAGRFYLISATGGYNAYLGNAPDTQGIFLSTPSAIAIREEEGKPDEEIDWRRHLLSALRREPMALPRALWLKTRLFWQSGEIPSGPNYYLQRPFSPLLWSPFRWGLIAPLGLLGMALAFMQRPPRRADDPRLLITGWLFVFMTSIILVFVMGRLRLPALAILFLFAGHASAYMLQCLLNAWRHVDERKRLWRVAASLGMGLLVGLGLQTRDPALLIGWNDHFNMGRAHEMRENWEEALEHYEQAILLAPDIELLLEARNEARQRIQSR